MQTIKTALVVTFLLAVLYVVYVTLNKPEGLSLPGEVAATQEWSGPEVELPGLESVPADLGTLSPPGAAVSPAESAAQSSLQDEFPLPQLPPSAEATPFPAEAIGQYADQATMAEGYNSPAPESVPAPPAESASDPAENHLAEESNLPHDPVNAFVSDAKPDTEGFAAQESAWDSADSPYEASTDTSSAPQAAFDSPYQPSGDSAGSSDLGASESALADYRFDEVWSEAEQFLEENEYARALAKLTELYREPGLSAERRRQLLDMLDQLAGTVIYSTEHRLEPPYDVKRGETLEEIAQRHSVPSELLFNVNRGTVREPDLLLPGTVLKVMRGPFHAEIKSDETDSTRGELTLFLGLLYAGRFPVTLGEQTPSPGVYRIAERLGGKRYFGRDGRSLEARDPSNPYGLHWLGFEQAGLGIHGQSRHGGPTDTRGGIGLNPRNAADVYGILSVGSKVKVLR